MKTITHLILVLGLILGVSCHVTYAQEAQAQFINNSLDTPDRIDIYINHERQASGLYFRWYTNYLPIPSGADLAFEVRATGSDPASPPLVSETYTIEEDGSYTIVLNGLMDGVGEDFLTFSLYNDANRPTGPMTGVEYLGILHHGLTDAGRLNVFDGEDELDQPNIVYQLGYGEFTNFATVLQKSETFVVKDVDNSSEVIGVFPYSALLGDIGGGITLVASGQVGSSDPERAFALVAYRQPSEGGPGRVIPNQQPSLAGEFDGKTYFINVGFDRSMEVVGESKSKGANVVIWDRNNKAHQQWTFTAVGDGYYEIRNLNSRKCLDVAGASTQTNANVLQWDCNGRANQQFRVEDIGAGRYRLIARHSGQNLEVENAGNFNGANVQQHDQHFYYFMLEESTGAATTRTAETSKPILEENVEADKPLFFPNPVDAELHLQLPADFLKGEATVRVYSATGQLLITQLVKTQTSRLPVETLRAGPYLIRVVSHDRQLNARFLKD